MKKSIILIFVFVLLISCKREAVQLVKIEGKLLPVTEKLPSDSTFVNLIEPYKVKIDKEMKTVLSYTPKNLDRTDGEMESSLGNLLADLCYEIANTIFQNRTDKSIDLALFNYGGIRSGISKGAVTYENAFKLMPFENSLVVVELTHDKLLELLDYLIKSNRAHPVSSSLRLKIKKDGFDFTINNQQGNSAKTYFVLTSDYLQNGGDNMLFFKDPINLYILDYKMRNAIIDYFKQTDTLRPVLDGRIKFEE